MTSLDGRALFALLACGFIVASACSSTSRSFPGGGAGDAGESASPEAGSTNHGGAAHGGGSSRAGAANGGAATAGTAGTGPTTGDAGEAGTPGTPECGAPDTACCEGNLCIAHAACTAATCKCSASYTACNGECVDFKTDGKNCGTCGHDCLGGTCELGSCQPATVATAQPRLSQMASDGKYLYWSGGATPAYYVARRRVDGTGDVKVLAASEQGAYALALSSDKVFWMAKGHLRSCDLPDCSAGPVDAISTLSAPSCGAAMLFEPTKKSLYWSCSSTYNAKDGTLYTLPSGANNFMVVGPNPANPGALVRDASNVYWINSSTYSNDDTVADAGLWRVRVSDGLVTQLAASLRGDVSYLASGPSALFFAGNIVNPSSNPLTTTTNIIRAPLPNGLSVGMLPKFADANTVRGMVADDTHLYFANESASQGTISRCPVDACPTPETIVPGLYEPSLGAQDAVSIYFASSNSDMKSQTLYNIQRLAK